MREAGLITPAPSPLPAVSEETAWGWKTDRRLPSLSQSPTTAVRAQLRSSEPGLPALHAVPLRSGSGSTGGLKNRTEDGWEKITRRRSAFCLQNAPRGSPRGAVVSSGQPGGLGEECLAISLRDSPVTPSRRWEHSLALEHSHNTFASPRAAQTRSDPLFPSHDPRMEASSPRAVLCPGYLAPQCPSTSTICRIASSSYGRDIFVLINENLKLVLTGKRVRKISCSLTLACYTETS